MLLWKFLKVENACWIDIFNLIRCTRTSQNVALKWKWYCKNQVFFIVYRTRCFKEQQKKQIVSSFKLESQIGNEKVVGISISKADPIRQQHCRRLNFEFILRNWLLNQSDLVLIEYTSSFEMKTLTNKERETRKCRTKCFYWPTRSYVVVYARWQLLSAINGSAVLSVSAVWIQSKRLRK